MTIAHPDAGRTAGTGRPEDSDARLGAWFGASARGLIGTFGLILLIGWLAYATSQNEAAIESLPQQQAEEAPVFDGRGKWSGYAR